MRDIKFRAWDKSTNSMIQDGENWKLYILNGCVSSIQDIWSTKDLELMQFTGLKDCNGVEVYEGDIVKADTHLSDGKIYHFDGCWWIINSQHKGKGVSIFKSAIEAHNIKVIGNIYENPELIES